MTRSIPLTELESSPSAKFASLGDSYAGTIIDIEQRAQTEIGTGKPVTYDDGSPRMQWVITLEQANGEAVTLYARGGKYAPAQGSGMSMLSAIGVAVRAAGAQAVEVGAQLAVAHTGNADAGPGKTAKLYTAQYKAAPAASVPLDLFSS